MTDEKPCGLGWWVHSARGRQEDGAKGVSTAGCMGAWPGLVFRAGREGLDDQTQGSGPLWWAWGGESSLDVFEQGVECSCPFSDPRAQVMYLGCLPPSLLPCQTEMRPGVPGGLNTHPGPEASQAEPSAFGGV